MKKLLIIIVLIFGILTSQPQQIFAQTTEEASLATCDVCGYCQDSTVPGNWEKCRDCVYPELGKVSANSNASLQVIENIPITPAPGRMYTMLGCINTKVDSFEQEGAAASVVQVLLNAIFGIVGGVGFLYLIYGAFIIITSQANPERLNYGKRLIFGAVIGVIFSLSAVFLVNLIAGGILKIPGFNAG